MYKLNLSVLPYAVAEHPVREVLVVAPEVVDRVDHARELALTGELLVQPGAGQPVGHVVILKSNNLHQKFNWTLKGPLQNLWLLFY